MSPFQTDLDTLELELRRIPGVTFVGFSERVSLIVHLILASDADVGFVHRAANEVCVRYAHGPVAVQLEVDRRPARVRLIDVRRTEQNDARVEVHLGYGRTRTVGRAQVDDVYGAATATVEALEKLGAELPFEISAAAVFEHEAGEGVMLVLGSERAGKRYGVAGGDDVAEAAARATLHALNRHLAAQPLAS